MKHKIVLSILLISIGPLSAVKFNLLSFDNLMRDGDFFKAKEYLNQFPQDSTDPDVLISRGWLALSWGFKVDVGDGLVTEDGKPAIDTGYPSYEEKKKLREEGRVYMEKAIKLYPNRIDAWLNLVGYYRRLGPFSKIINLTSKMFQLARTKGHKWKTRGSEEIKDQEGFFLGNLQGHLAELNQIDSPEAEKVYFDVSKALIEFAPNNIYGYNNLAIVHKRRKEWALAMSHLLKAQELDPNDIIIMGNLTQVYIAMGNKAKARSMCKKMLNHPSGQFHDWAEKTLKELE